MYTDLSMVATAAIVVTNLVMHRLVNGPRDFDRHLIAMLTWNLMTLLRWYLSWDALAILPWNLEENVGHEMNPDLYR